MRKIIFNAQRSMNNSHWIDHCASAWLKIEHWTLVIDYSSDLLKKKARQSQRNFLKATII